MSFGLDFADKAAVLASLGIEPSGSIQQRSDGHPDHALVLGDNLEVLRHLRATYAAKVQMIYIDPPYNTGHDFVYRDRWAETEAAYQARIGAQEGDSPLQLNPKTAGAAHSAYLAMMYPRLFLARGMLAEDGLMFVSIDDNEVHHVRMLLDEIFGEDCFIAQIVVVTNRGGRDYLRIATGHEYLLVYGASPTSPVRELPKEGPPPKWADDRGPYELRELRNRNPRFTPANRPNLHYPVFVAPERVDAYGCAAVRTEGGGAFCEQVVPRNKKGEPSVWRWGTPKLAGATKTGDPVQDEVVARRRPDGVFNIYEKYRKRTSKPKGLWGESSMRTEQGTIELRQALGAALFDHPKPLALVQRCIQLATDPDDALVLDFFAGSGTTAHAVALQNAADGGQRRSLSIQLDAPTPADSVAARAGCARLGEVAVRRLEHALGRAPSVFEVLDGLDERNPTAIGLRCGLGLHAGVRPEASVGWTLFEEGTRWLAIAGQGATLATALELDPPPSASFWLPTDALADWERLELARRFAVLTEPG